MTKIVGKEEVRIDGYEKITGKARYAADLKFHGMLHAKFLFSKYPHAKILGINVDKAKKLPGVIDIVTAADVPGENKWGSFRVFAKEKVRFVGDVLAAVAAVTPEIASQAVKLIEAEYEELPGVFTIPDALAPGAPVVNEEAPDNIIPNSHYPVRRGDVNQGFAQCDVVIEREYSTPFIEHCYIEPEAAVVVPDPSGAVTVYGSIQNPYSPREVVAATLGLPLNKVRIVQAVLGGTFGGKQESMCLLSSRLALLAKRTGKPVKGVYSREESIIASAKRHPFNLKYKIGATSDGKILALEAVLIDEGGGNNNQAQFQNWRASVHATGPYVIPNVKVDVYGVFTNNIFGGAMRGFTSPKVIFAQEQLMDELANALQMDPVELRLKNCFRPGSITATGQKLDNQSVVLAEVIQEAVERSQYRQKVMKNGTGGDYRYGIGLACAFRGCGLGAEAFDGTGAKVSIQEDGSVFIYSGLAENGQGMKTVYAQIVAEVLGISVDKVVHNTTDTNQMPNGGFSVASRGTLAGGKAMEIAAKKVKKTLYDTVARLWECDPNDLIGADEMIVHRTDTAKTITYQEAVKKCLALGESLTELGFHKPDLIAWDHDTGQGNAFPTYAYSCVVAEVKVDIKTGKVNLERVLSVHDVGKAINPGLAKGQIYGGIAMGAGFAVLEKMELSKGYVKSKNLDKYLILTAEDMPEVEAVLFESQDPNGPYGAKSLGEPATETVGAAIANAIANALEGRRIYHLPADLEGVYLGLDLDGKKGGDV